MAGLDNDTLGVLTACRDLELCLAKLYTYYAEIFRDNIELSRLWSLTALEEEGHAKHFELGLKLWKDSTIISSNTSLLVAERLLENVKSILDSVKFTYPSETEALQTAVVLEEGLMRYHLSNIAIFPDETLRQLYESMMRSDRAHVDRLEEALRELIKDPGTPP